MASSNFDSLDKKKIIIIFGLTIIAVLVLLIILNQRTARKVADLENAVTIMEPEENNKKNPADSTRKDEFQVTLAPNIKVPEPNTSLSEEEKKEIALPTISVPAGPGVIANFRNFEIRAEGGLFTPSKIIANQGDTVRIQFTAVDKDYDIVFRSYNMKQSAKKGETKALEFQAVQSGDYLYYCQSCGGINGTAKGHIIIVKK